MYLNAIYPALTDSNSPLPTSQHLAECAFLATRVDNLNQQLLASMRGEIFTLYSVDKAVDHGDAETYATKYLNVPNLPLCQLKLKSAHRSFFSEPQSIQRIVQWNPRSCGLH